MKRTTIFKSLLIAIAMLTGSNAWAGDVSTIYERGINTAWSTDDYTTEALTTDKWYTSGTGNTGLSISTIDETNYLHVSARGKTTTGSGTLKFSRSANSIVTIDAVVNTGSSTFPSNDNRITFKYGAFTLNYYTRYSNAEYYINSTKTSLPTLANNINLTIHLVVDSYNGEISALTVTRGDTDVEIIDITASDSKTFDAGTDYDVVSFEAYCNVSSNNTSANMASIKVQQETQDVATADYIVKWAYSNGTVIKEETRNAGVGTTIGLTSTDMNPFFNEDETVRYICLSNDLNETTVSDKETTVVTITVRDAEKWSWTATAKYGEDVLGYTQSGEVWEDLNTVSIKYPRFIAVGSQLIGKAPNGNDLRQNVTITSDAFTCDLVYSDVEGVDDLFLLSEAENLGTGLTTSSTNYMTRVSNDAIIYAAEGTLVTLPAGTYKFTLGAIGGDSNTHKVAYTVKAGETIIIEGTVTGNFLNLLTSEEFTLTESTPITFTCSDPASNRGIDLIYVQGTANSTTVTIGSTGFATYSNADFALDFTGLDVKAYTASLTEENTVLLTPIEKVPAGTGVMLKGKDSYDIPVIASATFSGTNLFVASTGEEVAASVEGKYHYALANGNNGVGFYNMESARTIAAGKAYIESATPLADAQESRVNWIFADEGIVNAIEKINVESAGNEVYNLNGQRVAAPQKGLYIVNGKKVVVK